MGMRTSTLNSLTTLNTDYPIGFCNTELDRAASIPRKLLEYLESKAEVSTDILKRTNDLLSVRYRIYNVRGEYFKEVLEVEVGRLLQFVPAIQLTGYATIVPNSDRPTVILTVDIPLWLVEGMLNSKTIVDLVNIFGLTLSNQITQWFLSQESATLP